MTRSTLIVLVVAIGVGLTPAPAEAQHQGHPTLHVSDRWKECSFQLSASLTPQAWHQFTREAGLVAYFRPVADARPMGRGNFEFSILQYETGIDDADPAWNDTFVHPDSTHYLFEGSGLKFPGLMVRGGLGDRTDAGVYFTRNPNANYGFVGVQVQRTLMGDASSAWAVAGRGNVMRLFGPEDLEFMGYGADLVASRRLAMSRWLSLSPYAGVSAQLFTSHEKSAVVNLADQRVVGAQATFGAAVELSRARVGVEYNAADVRTVSMKVGVGW